MNTGTPPYFLFNFKSRFINKIKGVKKDSYNLYLKGEKNEMTVKFGIFGNIAENTLN